jgi:hypothetical protein
MTTDARAKPAVGKPSLIVNSSVQDEAQVLFHRDGNDIVRLTKLVTLKNGEPGEATVDLQNQRGLIIAASEVVFLQKGERFSVGTFRTIQKVKLK